MGAKPTYSRSTKAGAETPATLVNTSNEVLVFFRSTKAGAETPATLTPERGLHIQHLALNEGRG